MPASRKAARATPAAALREKVESFLAGCRRPVLLEPGEAPFSLCDASEFRLTERPDCLLLEAWDETRTLARRVVAAEQPKSGRMTLTVVRFGGKSGFITLVDREKPQTAAALLRGSREILREQLRRWLARQYPTWRMAEITCGADLEHTLSPSYARALIVRGENSWAALAAPPAGVDAALTFGLIWLAYLRGREQTRVQGLILFLPTGSETNTLLRLRQLNVRAELYRYDGDGKEEAIDPEDHGNLMTRIEPWYQPPPVPTNEAETWLHQLSLHPDVQTVRALPGVVSLRVCGLEFARYANGELHAGVDRKRKARSLAQVESLAREIAAIRNADAPHPGHPWLMRNPEAWLESSLRGRLRVLAADLIEEPVYGQVPAFAGEDRGILDLLAVDRTGRLCVIELKASEDPQLPLQALDYWMRVAHHAERGDFAPQGYFRGLPLLPQRPRLFLVAPALQFHPSSETVLSFFSPNVEVQRIGLGVEWQKNPQVVLRAFGARSPEWG